MKRPKLSKAQLRCTQREAAEEFFRRQRRQATQVRSLLASDSPTADVLPATMNSEIPAMGTIFDINQSKEILKRIASGELKMK